MLRHSFRLRDEIIDRFAQFSAVPGVLEKPGAHFGEP
jgi:hypothetical protein